MTRSLYRILVEDPYKGTEEEYAAASLAGAVSQVEDLTGVDAAAIIDDLYHVGYPWVWVDPEWGREITLRPEEK